jgi:hypothetical protein
METVLVCTVFGVFLCISFLLGAKVGQKVANNEPITIPTLNPVKMVKNYKLTKKQQEEIDELNKLMQNIDNYDGSEIGQQEVNIE